MLAVLPFGNIATTATLTGAELKAALENGVSRMPGADGRNDFVAAGGDGYPNIIARSTTRELMDQVLADYITAAGTIAPSIQGRIVCTSSGTTACPVITAP